MRKAYFLSRANDLQKWSLSNYPPADHIGYQVKQFPTHAEAIKAQKELNASVPKRRRAPGAGRKRDDSLPAGPLAKLPPIWVTAEMLERLRALPDGKRSAFIREAIQEKLNTTDAHKQGVPADRK